jgi:preprotein translocase subunit SecD
MISVLAAVLLYFFAVGGVRGFAFTLGLTTMIDLLVVFIFTFLVSLVKIISGIHLYIKSEYLSTEYVN